MAPGSTVAQLGEELEKATGASSDTQKILGIKSRKGALCPGSDADAALLVSDVFGISAEADDKKMKPLMLMGSARADVDALNAAALVDHRIAGFDQEDKRLRRRRRNHISRAGASSSRATGPPTGLKYTFMSYKALDLPSTISPSKDAALALLHRLASDPGIIGVMQKHAWSVGLLAEMPPEGKVGLSEMCVLGYNVNAGQEIHLRLRTDDLKGFRRYARIRETLLHELTHNVWGDHDVNFKRLCSQLNRECAVFDWKRNGNGAIALESGGAASSGEDSLSEDEAMAATRAASGKALGGEFAGLTGASAREAAATAALMRAGSARAEKEMAAEAAEALAAHGGPNGGCSCPECTVPSFMQPTLSECVVVATPSSSTPDSTPAPEAPHPSGPTSTHELPSTSEPTSSTAAEATSTTEDTVPMDEDACPPLPMVAADTDMTDSAASATIDEPTSSSSGPELPVARPPQPEPELNPSAVAAEIAAAGGLNDEFARMHTAAAEAAERARAGCTALLASAPAPDAVMALDTLATILGNALNPPDAQSREKFRSIRLNNAAFQRRAGRHAGAKDVLYAAGFRDGAGASAQAVGASVGGVAEPMLRLERDDPALLYIVRDTVRDARATVAAMQ